MRRSGGAGIISVVIPIVTPEEMGAIDRAAPEPVDVLIGRAGGAVARSALDLLGGAYGRRVVVIAGKGNNGNDGREAARRLGRRGARVVVLDALDLPTALPAADLVIDAAFGTGFRGRWDAPTVPGAAPVLAVDIPSGLDGLTGDAAGRVLVADVTVTFAALKPGLVLGAGPTTSGAVRVADIGLDTSTARSHLVGAADVARLVPVGAHDTHKWRSAVWVVAGSPGMSGAAALAAGGAQRAGAGYVRLSTPGALPGSEAPVEAVRTALPVDGWSAEVLAGQGRFGALVVGNGLGTGDDVAGQVRALVAGATVPVVVDADGLGALGDSAAAVVGPSTILTPHDGEFVRLAGSAPGADRIRSCRELSARLGCVVLLKGPTTVVAEPGGGVLVSTAGDVRLATAGTGDVLACVVGALCARGVPPFEAAACAAHLHGAAALLGAREGFVAGDLPGLLPGAWAAVRT